MSRTLLAFLVALVLMLTAFVVRFFLGEVEVPRVSALAVEREEPDLRADESLAAPRAEPARVKVESAPNPEKHEAETPVEMAAARALPTQVQEPRDRSFLYVRDADTGQDLTSVRVVVSAASTPLDHPGPPDAGRVLVERGASPIELPPGAERYGFHVGAAGYAWTGVEIPGDSDLDRVVFLQPGGGVEVSLVGPDPPPGAVLFFEERHGLPYAEISLRGARNLLVDGLPAGKCEIEVLLGEFWREPLVLGRAVVDVVRSATMPVEIEISAAPDVVEVPLAGEIILPTAWRLPVFRLDVNLVGQRPDGRPAQFSISSNAMHRAAPDAELWSWSLPAVTPGTYELLLEALDYVTALEVGPAGELNARIEVPPPALLRIRLADARGGSVPEDAVVAWSRDQRRATSGWAIRDVPLDRAAGRYIVDVPRGSVRVFVFCEGYRKTWKRFEAGPGPTDVLFDLEPEQIVRLRLLDGGAIVPFPLERRARLVPLAGGEPCQSRTSGEDECDIAVPGPGIYRLELPEIPGYVVPSDELVTVEEGQLLVEHDVALKR